MQQQCKIVTVQQLTDRVHAITMEAGEIAHTAKPGQFLHILCGTDVLLRRPISICDNRSGLLKIVFEARGKGTRWLAAQKRGMLDVLGPLGSGFSLTGRNILLVGGGIGVPPLLYAARQSMGVVTAILGFRSKGEVILHRQFANVCKRVTITTDDGSQGIAGFVTAPLEQTLASGEYDAVLACGPTPMLKSVADLSSRYGVHCQVSLEERMACGVGACLGCAVTMQNGENLCCCTDGPVFSAEEVRWNG